MLKLKLLMKIFDVVLVLAISSHLDGFSGFYQANLNLLYCDQTSSTCRHEVAHLMDKQLGYPSHSERFGETLYMQLYTQIRFDQFDRVSDTIIFQPGLFIYSEQFTPTGLEAFSSPQEEVYARLYALVDGDIDKLPEGLRQFYSDDPLYQQVYQDLVSRGLYFYSPHNHIQIRSN